MNKSKQTWIQTVIAVATAALVVGGLVSTLCSADPTSTGVAAQTNSVVQQPATAFTSGQAYTGSLMNLYGNIGATAANSNHFTAAGGR